MKTIETYELLLESNITEVLQYELPSRMFFIETDEGEKIATATAFYDIYGRDTSNDGWLHWVAVKREYQENINSWKDLSV